EGRKEGRKEERMRRKWNLPLWLKKAAEAMYVLGVSLHGGPERPLCEAVKVKSGLPWRPQDVGDARVIGYLLRRAANRA
ncbi:hypothetical protein ACQP3J_33175, partial [Escherichia coli]